MEEEVIIKDNEEKGLVQRVRDHLVDSTALVAQSTPVFAAIETLGPADMSNWRSATTRGALALATYCGGMGFLYTGGRKISEKIFKVKGNPNELIKGLHDSLYTSAFYAASSPIIYPLMGETDSEKLKWATISAGILGLGNGYFAGLSVDIFKDLTGLEECNRKIYPDLIKERNSEIKKSVAALLTTGALALTSGIYYLNTYLEGLSKI